MNDQEVSEHQRKIAAANDVASHLTGTAGTLEYALEALDLPLELENSATFCLQLDQQVFCCETCGWWCEQSEMADGEEWICSDCEVT